MCATRAFSYLTIRKAVTRHLWDALSFRPNQPTRRSVQLFADAWRVPKVSLLHEVVSLNYPGPSYCVDRRLAEEILALSDPDASDDGTVSLLSANSTVWALSVALSTRRYHCLPPRAVNQTRERPLETLSRPHFTPVTSVTTVTAVTTVTPVTGRHPCQGSSRPTTAGCQCPH